ncbi:hypothetical protein [Longimicrobium sp.]|uniref:hypothetical protein n=1 Tax=Longimicrobium sp. TaxID=2029185 RepID=UPI002C6FF112|nr:hypothetical protein [Longimicrobium sp.]HSU13304.1 hypothetical protein [Longimicrobium sp.]
MLIIRDAQMEAFRLAALRPVEDRCVRLVREHWSALYAARSEADVRAELRHLFAVAPRWGFRSERELFRLANAACFLGLGFQRAPEAAWAVRILEDAGAAPGARLRALFARFDPEAGA